MTECYGCGKEAEYTKSMKVEHNGRQRFCEECYKNLVKIKMGLL